MEEMSGVLKPEAPATAHNTHELLNTAPLLSFIAYVNDPDSAPPLPHPFAESQNAHSNAANPAG